MDRYQELESEFKDKYPTVNCDEVMNIIDKIANDFEAKASFEGYDVYVSIEKIHTLQENVFVEISADDFELHLEFENGINNGTQLRDYSFSSTFLPKSRTVDVFSHVEIDEKRILLWGAINEVEISLVEANIIFNRHKYEIESMIRKQNYDNYVTGGGTNVTDDYYTKFNRVLNNKGLFWKRIYKEVEADVYLK